MEEKIMVSGDLSLSLYNAIELYIYQKVKTKGKKLGV